MQCSSVNSFVNFSAPTDTLASSLRPSYFVLLLFRSACQDDIIDFCEENFEELCSHRRLAVELSNGRAAQMGILALMVHEKLDNNPYVINSLLGFPVPFNSVMNTVDVASQGLIN